MEKVCLVIAFDWDGYVYKFIEMPIIPAGSLIRWWVEDEDDLEILHWEFSMKTNCLVCYTAMRGFVITDRRGGEGPSFIEMALKAGYKEGYPE